MENIKKYFIRPTVDDFDQLIVKSDENNSEINTNDICNGSQYDEININQPNIESTDMLSVEDSNKHFIRKIQSLEEENDRLQSIIENNHLTTKDKKTINNKLPDFSNKKIMQLTERVQQLQSELKSIKLSASNENDKNNDVTEVKQLTDKLNLSNKKICNYRNQIIQLKNDLKVAQNALHNEIGDPALTQAILSGTGFSNVRGRAQQILMLQQKVNELQANQNCSKHKYPESLSENKSVAAMRQAEKSRKAISDQALTETRSKVNDLTKSLEIWKSRGKALNVEITVLRMQVQKLLSKSEQDNQLIDNLKAELNNYNTENCTSKDSTMKLEKSIKLLQSKIEKKEKIINQQALALHEKDTKIANLESKILNQNEINSNCSIRTTDFSDPKEVFMKKIDKLENQQLMELLCVAHKKMCEQINVIGDFENKYLMEKQKLRNFETRIGLLSSPSLCKRRSNNPSYHVLHEPNPDEKLADLQNKLEITEEECAALKNRIDTLIMANKENVHSFTKALNDLKKDYSNEMNQ